MRPIYYFLRLLHATPYTWLQIPPLVSQRHEDDVLEPLICILFLLYEAVSVLCDFGDVLREMFL